MSKSLLQPIQTLVCWWIDGSAAQEEVLWILKLQS